jgi:hypothetical protein
MAEGTPIHQTVSPFARRHPSSDLGRGERARGYPTPRTIAPATTGARSAARRARAKSFANAPRLLSSASARDLLRAGRGSLVSARKRIEGQRNRHRLVPATRVRGSGSSIGVPARRIQGCRKSASVAEAPEKRVPGGNGAREREPGQRVRKGQLVKRRRQPGSRWPNRASGEGSSQGARKGIAGQRSLSNGRHLGPLSHRYRFTRPVGVGLGGDCHGNERVSAKGRGGRRDRGVRSASAHMARGRQRPRHEEKPTVRSAEASLSGVNQEVPRQARASSP